MRDDQITINGVCFLFREGKNIHFLSPSGQIYNPHRDDKGTLIAEVIQYVVSPHDYVEVMQEVTQTIEAEIVEPYVEEGILELEDAIAQMEIEAGQEVLRELGRQKLLEEYHG
ncbi:MAG: hypothetical protein ACRC0X_09330 [Brevinema sp.]